MKKIIYTLAGRLIVDNPAYNAIPPVAQEEALRIALEKVPAEAANVRVVDEAELPQDRTFRDAWTIDCGVDMAKAREIHRKKLREMRAPLMAALDVQYMRADEAGDTAAKSSISAKKQALRDVTNDPAIDQASSPDELKGVLPQCLR